MIKVIIADYGNVLARLGSNDPGVIEAIAQTAGITVQELKQRINGDQTERWNRAKHGYMTEAVYRAEVGAGLTTVTGDWIVDHYFEIVRLHSELIDYLKARHGQVKLAILSNAIPYFSTSWEKLGFSDWFDLLINSSAVGLSKPDPKAFALVTDHFQVRPEECIFIDDQWKNIVGAQALGFQTVHYQDAAQALAALDEILQREQVES